MRQLLSRTYCLYLAVMLPAAFFLLQAGCARSFNPDVERGVRYEYREGYPEVRLSAVGFLDRQNRPKIDIIADIVYGSLAFKRKGDKRIARLAIELRVIDRSRGDRIVSATRFSYDQETDNPELAQSQDVFTFEKQLEVQPGRYEIQLSVIDQHTGRASTQSFTTSIPDPDAEISDLTNIRMLGKEIGDRMGNWFLVPTYNVPGKLDSLKFIFQMINKSGEDLTINSRLVKFEADTTPARAMHQVNYSPSSLRYKGIDYENTQTVQTNRRVLSQQGSVSIEYFFPVLSSGNYRFEVSIRGDGENRPELYKARDFAIRSRNYPTLGTARELAEPLIYLMNNREYEELMAIHDPDSLKQAIDRFWLSNIRNVNDARSVLELYYERVEEANKKFTNFKEGWKTDRGMVYILFGSPWYVDEIHNELYWSFTYNTTDPDLNYLFTRNRLRSEFFPFDHFILQRSQHYYNVQYRQVQLWKSGYILIRKL